MRDPQSYSCDLSRWSLKARLKSTTIYLNVGGDMTRDFYVTCKANQDNHLKLFVTTEKQFFSFYKKQIFCSYFCEAEVN